MSTQSRELNFLNINSFVMEIARIPVMKFGVQEITFPDTSLPEVKMGNPFRAVNAVGDHIMQEDFTFTFIIDEAMANYRALLAWMQGLGFPEDYKQHEEFINGRTGSKELLSLSNSRIGNQFSDITVTILTNHKNPSIRYTMRDCFPVNLSGFSVNVTDSDSTPVTATCSMKFTGFDIEVLKK